LIRRWPVALTLIMTPLAACAAAPDPPDVGFACAYGRGFEVRYAGSGASVTITGGVYELARGASSIGRRFTSPAVTLLIDDESASLVVDGEPRYIRCRKL
jgi:hypothetical protein